MGNHGTYCYYHLVYAFQILLLVQISQVFCFQYKVGDLDSWGIPSEANPQVYTKWSKYHTFKIGDSILFLYPPSQDSVIQVTQESYNSCNTKDPILYMNNGNSVFNITDNGDLFFTSGVNGHCGKKQKLQISVGNGSAADGPSGLPDTAPSSYPTVFGPRPVAPSSSSPSSKVFPFLTSLFIGSVINAIL